MAARGMANFSLSLDGSLVYAVGGRTSAVPSTLVWVDRNGREEPIAAEPGVYSQPDLSPDGRRIAVHVQSADSDIWIYDVARDRSTRLTFDPEFDGIPRWSPDGQRIVFASNRGDGITRSLFSKSADGLGGGRASRDQAKHSVSQLLVERREVAAVFRLWAVRPLDGVTFGRADDGAAASDGVR